jgi:cytidine deaminase
MEKGKVVIGENSERITYGNTLINRHAEIDALQRMVELLRCKKIKKNKMNLIVLRVNKSGNLCESAPCYHCTMFLKKNNDINIDKLYFSRGDGSITCMKFDDWYNHGDLHVSKGWKYLCKKNK